jgi:hypothetical protein
MQLSWSRFLRCGWKWDINVQKSTRILGPKGPKYVVAVFSCKCGDISLLCVQLTPLGIMSISHQYESVPGSEWHHSRKRMVHLDSIFLFSKLVDFWEIVQVDSLFQISLQTFKGWVYINGRKPHPKVP